MKQIAAALVKAQTKFGPALKTSTNPAFKSRYADLSACVEAVIDALNTNGIMLMQPCHETETGVLVETLFIHESGETFSAGKLHVPAAKQDPQGYGSALTYARRYSLMAACGIAPEDDDGNKAVQAIPKAGAMNPKALADWMLAIDGAQSMDELKGYFSDAFAIAKEAKDTKAMERLVAAKDLRKTQLEKAA